MDAVTAGLVGSIAVATIAAVSSVLTARVARAAERNTRPISNGFASDVLKRLDRIEDAKGDANARLARIEGLIVNHLAEHAAERAAALAERAKHSQPE